MTDLDDDLITVKTGESQSDIPTHYVGIGASAGGLEALQLLFDQMPCDAGISFIVIQHLSPDFKSVMAELLSKHTVMPVLGVVDGSVVQPNTIYLIPPRKNLKIAKGCLKLSDQLPDHGISLPIDIFFRSLADDKQHQAIAIVLSGTGNDGSQGVRAVKEAGGLVVVQEPSSAKFDGMPHSAVNTGMADFVLEPQEVADQLTRYLKHPLISGGLNNLHDHLESTEALMKELFAVLKARSSIDFSQYKDSTVRRRVERRMGINQLTELEAYLALLSESPKEQEILSKELLIGVTRFFRDESSFNILEKTVIKEMVTQAAADDGLRVWVPGCSSGEEAYSLAILFYEAMESLGVHRHLKIFATDVNSDAIGGASLGRYSPVIVQDIAPERLVKFFKFDKGYYEVKPELRQSVVFATHNMITDPPFSNIDLVSCRNVMIYFQERIQQKMLASFHFSLKKYGHLFLGASESLGGMKNHFEVKDERCKLYSKITNVRVPLDSPEKLFSSTLRSSKQDLPSLSSLLSNHRGLKRTSPFDYVKERLINRYTPPCIILNEEYEAVHVYGDVAPYVRKMPVGRVTTNIKELIVDDLGVAVSTALSRAEKIGGEVTYTDISIDLGDGEVLINLGAQCFKQGENAGVAFYYCVMFHVTGEKPAIAEGDANAGEASEAFNANNQSRQRILDLENELLKKQEHLQVAVEELETTNEELQSANEELMSGNEELQSTNEELQSVNEELFTVNSEYQEKISELTTANDDLDNVLGSSRLGIVFLDDLLLIRKYTDVASRFVNLMPGDLGRPFHHIEYNFHYPNLFDDISSVIKTMQPIEKEVELSKSSGVALVQIKPYIKDSSKSKTSGVAIMLTDLTDTLSN